MSFVDKISIENYVADAHDASEMTEWRLASSSLLYSSLAWSDWT